MRSALMSDSYGATTPLAGRAGLRRNAILLQYGVVLYNVFEFVIARCWLGITSTASRFSASASTARLK